MDYEVRNNLLESENKLYKAELEARLDKIKELEEENRKLKKEKKSEYGACWLWLFFIVIYSLLVFVMVRVLPR